MATLSLTSGVKKFSWTISGLGNNFNTTYYQSAGVTSSNFTQGASSISGIISSKNATASGTSKSVSMSNVSYTSGTGRFTWYGFARALNGNYYQSGSASVTITNASYTISSSTSTSITIKVTVDSNCSYCAAICRLTSDTSGGTWTTMTSRSGTWTYTFSGLTPGEDYTVNVRCSPTSSTSYAVLLGAKTKTLPLPTPTTTLSTTVLSHNAIRATFTYDSNYPYYRLRWKPSSSSTWIYSGSSYTSYSSTVNYSIGTLSTNTQYNIEVLVATSSSGANSTSGDTATATTLPALSANISITSIGENSVSGTVTIDANYRYIQAIYRKSSTSTASYYPTSLTRRTGTSWSFTISELDSDTDYVLNGRCSATGEDAYAYNILNNALTFHTLAQVTVTPWSWTSANSTVNPSHTAEATDSQTTAARNACQNKTAVSNFKYQVWNDLVYKVSEARVAGGHSEWNNNYATRANTLMTSSSKTLTATRYNSMKYNLGEVYSTGISDVTSGVTEVNGTTHFINFVTKLNNYINSL